MKQEAIYTIRLLLLAEYLENVIKKSEPEVREVMLEWPLHYLDVFYYFKYNTRIFDGLLKLFSDHWQFDEEFQEPHLKSLPGYGLSRGVMFFFGLKSPEEFIHLFDCHGTKQNIARWGGLHIISTSSPFDIAHNIREFIKHKK